MQVTSYYPSNGTSETLWTHVTESGHMVSAYLTMRGTDGESLRVDVTETFATEAIASGLYSR